MAEHTKGASAPVTSGTPSTKAITSFTLFLSALVPFAAVVVLYRIDSFQVVEFPAQHLGATQVAAPLRNPAILRGAEFVGAQKLKAPEDVLYEPESGVIYTGCVDGWIKRVTINESVVDTVVHDWFHTGGRPLGLALGHHGEVFVADADKGLLKISKDGNSGELLTDEAGGVKFMLTDDVDVATNGMIYFTDASYKYKLRDFMLDILEGKPHGRLLSYDPDTKQTSVLLDNLFFANGIVVSPDQSSVIFCETVMCRCRRYHITGEKTGHVEEFVENLPGMPDNIRYDGHGSYWIAIASSVTTPWRLAFKYPWLRKIVATLVQYNLRPQMEKDGGVVQVDVNGNPISHYSDQDLSLISTGVRIGNQLYFGSVQYPYIIRLDMTLHPAVQHE